MIKAPILNVQLLSFLCAVRLVLAQQKFQPMILVLQHCQQPGKTACYQETEKTVNSKNLLVSRISVWTLIYSTKFFF